LRIYLHFGADAPEKREVFRDYSQIVYNLKRPVLRGFSGRKNRRAEHKTLPPVFISGGAQHAVFPFLSQ